MKTSKLFKVSILAFATMTLLVGCGVKNDTAAQEAVHSAMVNSRTMKAFNYDVALSGKISAGKDSNVKFKELNGSIAASGAYNIKVAGDPKIDLKLDAKGTMDGGKEQAVAGELVLPGKNLDFNISNVSLDALPDLYKEAIKQFMNKWWYVPLPANTTTEFSQIGIDEKDMTPAQKQMKDLYVKTVFFKNVVSQGEEKVGTADATKYSIELDKEAFKQYLMEVAKINGNDTQNADIPKLDKFLSMINFSGNVWVSKEGNYLVKVDGKLNVVAGAETGNMNMDIKLGYTLDSVNGDIKIEDKKDAVLLDLSKMMGGAMPKTK